MSLPDRRIDPKILKSAEEEFMEKGFADASLREICKKAGVTTGAMYKRYPGKEALFEAVVGPTLQDIEEMALNIERYDYEQLAHGKMQSVWDMSSTTLKTIPIAFRISFLTFSTTIFPSFLGISPTYSYRTIYPFVQCVNIIFTPPPLHMSYFHHFPYKIHLFLCIMTSFSRADFLTSAYTI